MVRTQGGYFFMYFKISFTAVNTIAKASNVITSTISQYAPPFCKGAETAVSVTLNPIRVDSFNYINKKLPDSKICKNIADTVHRVPTIILFVYQTL